jgi:hypothetical protein
VSREADGPGLRLPGPSEDIRGGYRQDVACIVTDADGITWLRRLAWPPSSYGLTHAQLAAHVRQLRREGWQSWEIRARFDFGACA